MKERRIENPMVSCGMDRSNKAHKYQGIICKNTTKIF